MKKFIIVLALLILTACSFEKNQTDEIMVDKNPLTEKLDKIVLVKFFDFQCIYCQKSNQVMNNLSRKFGKKLEIKYKHFPVLNKNSQKIAEVSECARDQGKFREFKDLYFKNYFGKSDLKTWENMATTLSLNLADFLTCIKSEIKKSVIEENLQEGRKLGIKSVPFFIVGAHNLKGFYPETIMEKMIEKQLK